MLDMVGGVRGPLHGPFIYLIRARDLLYVGQTQSHPALRWGSHLSPDGSFRSGLERHGDPEVDYLGDVAFAAFHCPGIVEAFAPTEIRIATQAVEHALHRVLAVDPTHLASPFRLISDTVRTAPRRFRGWPIAEALAVAIATALRDSVVWRLQGA